MKWGPFFIFKMYMHSGILKHWASMNTRIQFWGIVQFISLLANYPATELITYVLLRMFCVFNLNQLRKTKGDL